MVLAACGGSNPVSTKATTPPSTAAPSTAAPSTAAPTTAAPTTAAPRTAAPTTAVPTTAAPTTTTPKSTTTKPSGPGSPSASSLSAALKVKGPGPFKISSSGNPNAWPNVCSFLTVSELKALDPSQITGPSGHPVGTKASIIGGSGGNAKHFTDCKYNVKTSIKGYPGSSSYVEVSLQEIDSLAAQVWREDNASTKKASKKYPGQYADYSALPGGTKCFYDGSQLQCLSHDVYFDVAGNLNTASSTDDQKPWVEHALVPTAVKLGSQLS